MQKHIQIAVKTPKLTPERKREFDAFYTASGFNPKLLGFSNVIVAYLDALPEQDQASAIQCLGQDCGIDLGEPDPISETALYETAAGPFSAKTQFESLRLTLLQQTQAEPHVLKHLVAAMAVFYGLATLEG